MSERRKKKYERLLSDAPLQALWQAEVGEELKKQITSSQQPNIAFGFFSFCALVDV